MITYIDKNGWEIKAGMKISICGELPVEVFATSNETGAENLSINASNPKYLEHHPEAAREYYPLTPNFSHRWEGPKTVRMINIEVVKE